MGTASQAILGATEVKESEPTSLLHDFVAQQHANVFARAFSFAADQLPAALPAEEDDTREILIADRVMVVGDIGFVFQLREREQKVTAKSGDLEKWVAGQVVRKGVTRVHNTRELLSGYAGLSVVNHFGHRINVTPKNTESYVGIIIYRVPPKTRPFRAARFKQNRNGGFVHILRDTEYFEICNHFVTPAELADYFAFRRDMLIGWDPPSTAVSESAFIGQYLLEDFSSPPSASLERAARRRQGPTSCEFSFVLDSLATELASVEEHSAESDDDGLVGADDFYEILSEIGVLSRYDLRALKEEFRLALEAVRANRFEQPFRMASARTGCGFLLLPVIREFQDRLHEALESLAIASKHELDLKKQVAIGLWQSGEFVEMEWLFLEGENPPQPELDARLLHNYPFRRASERRLPPIFT